MAFETDDEFELPIKTGMDNEEGTLIIDDPREVEMCESYLKQNEKTPSSQSTIKRKFFCIFM